MKVCTVAHHVPAFGDIPEGSLWADDSPYLVEPDNFVDVFDERPPAPPAPAVRKFGTKNKKVED